MPSYQTGHKSPFVFEPLQIKASVATDYPTVAADFKGNVAIVVTTGAANTLTVPTGMKATRALLIINDGIGLTTVTPAVGVTIKSAADKMRLTEQYSCATLIPDPSADDTYWLTGALS